MLRRLNELVLLLLCYLTYMIFFSNKSEHAFFKPEVFPSYKCLTSFGF